MGSFFCLQAPNVEFSILYSYRHIHFTTVEVVLCFIAMSRNFHQVFFLHILERIITCANIPAPPMRKTTPLPSNHASKKNDPRFLFENVQLLCNLTNLQGVFVLFHSWIYLLFHHGLKFVTLHQLQKILLSLLLGAVSGGERGHVDDER